MPSLLPLMKGAKTVSAPLAPRPGPVSLIETSTWPSRGLDAIVTSFSWDDFHRFYRIVHKVYHHLLDLDGVHAHPFRLAIEREFDLDALTLGVREQQRAGVADDLVQVVHLGLDLPVQHEGAQPAHDLGGAPRRRARQAERQGRLPRLVGGQRPQDALAGVDIGGHRAERLAELVRERRRHRPHRADPRGVDELVLGALQLLLRALPLGDVADEDRHAGAGRKGADLEPERIAAGTDRKLLERRRYPVAHHGDPELVERAALAILRPGLPDRPVDDLRRRPALDPRRLGVHRPDAKVLVDEDEAFADMVQELTRLFERRHVLGGERPDLPP